jgi:CDP-diglyceride synthetase
VTSFPDLLRRTAVAAPGIALFAAVVLLDSDLLTVCFFSLVAGLAAWEAVGLLSPGSGPVPRMVGLVLTGAASAGLALGVRYAPLLVPAPGVVLSLYWLGSSGFERAGSRIAGGTGLLGLVALGIGLLCRHVLTGPNGYLVAVPLLICWLGDSAAYFTGSALGRHRLMPAVSPSKTVEGLLAGLAGSACGALAAGTLLLGFPAWQMIVTGALGGIAAVAGDLIESALKRDAGVKDSGKILPGHGGILDRFDSLILVSPVTWVLLSQFGHTGGA